MSDALLTFLWRLCVLIDLACITHILAAILKILEEVKP